MSAMKTKRNVFTSPKGIAAYAYLNKPDTAFNQAGVYKTKLKISNDNAEPLMNSIKEAAKAEFGSKATNARMPFEIDEDTGEVTFTVKSNYKPKFADTKGKLISEGSVPDIFSGSTLKVQGNIHPYNNNGMGISLQMFAVQIIELQERTMNAFEEEEGSFIASNDNAPQAEGEDYNF